MKRPAPIADLALIRAKQREPDMRLFVAVWRIGDGRIGVDWEAEARTDMPPQWVRAHAPVALEMYREAWVGREVQPVRRRRHRVRRA